uniref:Uncharacterized protein n=1 Tax=Pithovirus LCDPAC02 TaxID=2506601 RepID=A0A481YQ43_9VIRU|nr:MAG: hypothetical protein LCDPAC02_03680 [Pithovirus LCDPAC02]
MELYQVLGYKSQEEYEKDIPYLYKYLSYTDFFWMYTEFTIERIDEHIQKKEIMPQVVYNMIINWYFDVNLKDVINFFDLDFLDKLVNVGCRKSFDGWKLNKHEIDEDKRDFIKRTYIRFNE